MNWDDFPVILGYGQCHDLRGDEGPAPRLYGMKSVSRAGCYGLHKEHKTKARKIGFKFPKRVGGV